MSEEDIEQVPRRRSARIIALEEKKEREKKALDEARKNRGKAVIVEEDHDLIDDEDDDEDDDEYAPIKKRGRKSRPLNQLISLTQPIHEGQYTEYSRRYGLPRVPPKDMLEFLLDLLQRKDPDEFFAQPVNPDQDYHKIVKEPMDFGTMRAKLHENMYTNMDQFKRDVYLLCSNAMNVNPSSTSPHKVAEAINNQASKLFHSLSTHDPGCFYGGNPGFDEKKSRGRKTYVRSKNSGRPRQLPSEPGGGHSGANNSMEAEVEKRQTYYPSGGDSIFSGVLDGPKSNLQFHKPSRYYQDSLVRFVEDLGPTVKKCAARKIESLRHNQIMRGEATRPNPLANFLDPTQNTMGPASTVLPRPPPPRQPTAATRLGHDAPHSRHSPILSNRPLTIPGFTPQAPQETRNMNLDRDDDYKGKKVAVDSRENCDAYAVAILSGCFMNNAGRGRGLNLNGEGSSSSSNMASSFHQNGSSFLTMSPSFQEANQNQNQWMQRTDRPESSNARNNFVNTPGNTGSNVAPREFTQVRTRVWPSIVISGPQAHTRPNNEPISTSDRQVTPRPAVIRPLPGQSLVSRQNLVRHEQEPTLGQNLSEHSLLPQNLTEFDFTLLKQALWSQQIPAEQVTGNNFTWQSFMPQNKSAMFLNENNLSWQFLMPQQIPQEAMNMAGYNCSGQSLLSQQSRSNSNPMNGYTLSGGQSFMSQQTPEEAGLITGWQYLLPQSDSMTCQSFMPQQKPQDARAQALTGCYDNLSQVAHLTEEGTSNLHNLGNTYQPEDFQTIWAPIDLNSIPFTDQARMYTAPPAFFDNSGDKLMQPQAGPEPSQLNPLGPFPRQMPRPLLSSASLEMPMGLDAMNYYVGNAMAGQPVAGGGEGTSTAQLQWDDDCQPNLALQL